MVRRLLSLRWRHLCVPLILDRLTLADCLSLRRVSKECRRLVDSYLAHLRSLEIVDEPSFRRSSFRALFPCKRIRVLKFTKCPFLTDDLLVPLLRGNTRLTHVNLSRSRNITAKSLQPIILDCPNLKTLKLSCCSWLTPGAVEALALHQSALEEVDFSYCGSVSESSLVIFLKKFRSLRILSLEGMPQATDRCLFAASRFTPFLEHLNVANCPEITDAGIRSVFEGCPRLKSLAVRNCISVTERSLQLIRTKILIDRSAPYPRNMFAEMF